MRAPCVGRRGELDGLLRLVDLARRDRRPAVALITGDPGAGKSRLLGEAIRGLSTGSDAGLAARQVGVYSRGLPGLASAIGFDIRLTG